MHGDPPGWRTSRILSDGRILRAPIGENAPARKGWLLGNRPEPEAPPVLSPLEAMLESTIESERYKANMPAHPVDLSTKGVWPTPETGAEKKGEENSMSSQENNSQTLNRAQILELRKHEIYEDPHFNKSDPRYKILLEELQGIQREQAGMGTSKT